MLIRLKKTQKGLQCGNYFLLRCLSVLPNIQEGVDNNHSQAKKRFAVLKRDRNTRPLNKNILCDIFLGEFDKGIFKYPNFAQSGHTESLLRHISEIENYLSTLPEGNVEINKGVLNKLQELELPGLTVPQKYGGLEYSESESNFIYEHLGTCPRICNLLSYNENFGIKILNLYGTEEQKLKYLPKLASGECFISLAYLENGPLADLKTLNCNLVKDEGKDCFLINGEKKWVANANISDLIIVLSKSKTVDGEKPKVKFNLNLIEKNSPGVTVKEVQSNREGLLGLYNVKFDNVIAQNNSFISSDTSCGFSIVKNALSFSNLGTSVQCLSVLKKILRIVSAYHAKVVPEKALNELGYLSNNVKWLSTYTYALESVTSVISDWFDEFDRPDLFAECTLTKILATNLLQSGINKYLQIMGTECFKPSSVLEEVLQVFHHSSVFPENNIYLKPSIGCYGLLHAARLSSEVRKTVLIRRQPYNYPWESLIHSIKADRGDVKESEALLKMKDKIHPSLDKEFETLWWCSRGIRVAIERHLINHGNKATESDKFTSHLTDIAAYTFTLAACISRASASLYNKTPGSEEELRILQTLACEAKVMIKELTDDVVSKDTRPYLFEKIGDIAFNAKKYPIEHPLSRSY